MNTNTINQKYGHVGVTVVPIKESLNKIWKIDTIQHLHIVITPPNPDRSTLAETVAESLRKQKARKKTIILDSVSGEGLDPDPETRDVCTVAAVNGFVTAKGKMVDGKKVEESTQSHPMKAVKMFDPDVETEPGALEAVAHHDDNFTALQRQSQGASQRRG